MNIKPTNIIVATDEAGGIGYNNKMPWDCPLDMQRFRNMTMGNVVIMGRETFDSLLNSPLPGRINIVLSRTIRPSQTITPFRTEKDSDTSLYIVDSVESSLKLAEPYKDKRVWVIGGQSIYEEFLNKDLVQTIFMARMSGCYKTDKKFPSLDKSWECIELWDTARESKQTNGFFLYIKKNKYDMAEINCF